MEMYIVLAITLFMMVMFTAATTAALFLMVMMSTAATTFTLFLMVMVLV